MQNNKMIDDNSGSVTKLTFEVNIRKKAVGGKILMICQNNS